MSYRSNWGRTHHPPQLELDVPTVRQCSCGTDRKDLCAFDHDRTVGAPTDRRRPKDCLNQYDPATAPIPYA